MQAAATVPHKPAICCILPFAQVAGGPRFIIPISGRVVTNLAAETGLAEADAGWSNDFTVIPAPINDPGFVPAKAICFKPTGTAAAAPSKITGMPYKRRTGQSFTIPFGANSATETYFAAMSEFIAGTAALHVEVSFTPERMYRYY